MLDRHILAATVGLWKQASWRGLKGSIKVLAGVKETEL